MDFSFLTKTTLFQGISENEIQEMLHCLGAETRMFPKGAVIYRAGDVVRSMGLVLSGSVNLEHDDVWGNKTILDHAGPGYVFAETYACVPGEPLMIQVAAAEDSHILFLNVARVLKLCPSSCSHHSTLIRNLLSVTAQKNLALSRRIFHTSSKSIRGRLLSYLSFQAVRHGSSRFSIPFNRQQLADYLGVDRSALSNELGKMQRDGLLSFEKNHFCLHKNIAP
ncbi:MAG: Crp/Fnr family transcriptional regulator [Lachnospiraceae bacterium]|nr:Crp/Fnr family transcriptional regulator [Lachnospiraceae bacterium]